MLSHLYVDGFKSLEDFQIDFGLGINALIGPNGSGKTTICQALGMLPAIASNNIEDYLLSIGGSSSIFNTRDENNSISIVCSGNVASASKDNIDMPYAYVYRIVFSIFEKFKIEDEALFIRTFNKKTKRLNKVIDIEREENNYKFYIYNHKFLGPHMFTRKNKRTHRIDIRAAPLSLISAASMFTFIGYKVESDLKSINMYNINPNVAKKPSDILDSSTMSSEGKNLANNIFHYGTHEPEKLELLSDFVRKICSRYQKIEASNLEHDSKLRTFYIKDKAGTKCQATNLSDGTIKAIAMYVATLNSSGCTDIIEEPENYIHPWGCKLIIDHIRETFISSTCIITTHSETVLNSIKPSEIIVCENTEGETKTRRIEDISTIETIIQDTGFGCGYHYASGILGGTPSC